MGARVRYNFIYFSIGAICRDTLSRLEGGRVGEWKGGDIPDMRQMRSVHFQSAFLITRLGICEAGLAWIRLEICVFRKENANLQLDSRQPSFTNPKPGHECYYSYRNSMIIKQLTLQHYKIRSEMDYFLLLGPSLVNSKPPTHSRFRQIVFSWRACSLALARFLPSRCEIGPPLHFLSFSFKWPRASRVPLRRRRC